MNSFNYHLASLEDCSTIVAINNQRINRDDQDGFILDKYTIEETSDKIEQGVLFYIIKNQDQPVAYLELAEKIDWRIPNELDWVSDETKTLFLKSNLLYLDRICTIKKPEALGAGSFAYKDILPLHSHRTLYCFIVTKPVINESSIKFHEKNGFHHVATFTKDEYAGFKNYECRMYSNLTK